MRGVTTHRDTSSQNAVHYRCVKKLQSVGLQVLADCVINHRCASNQAAFGYMHSQPGILQLGILCSIEG